MFLYNLTLIVEDKSAVEFHQYIISNVAPKAMETGLFKAYNLLKVVDSPNEGITYCLQFLAETELNYNQYVDNFSSVIEGDMDQKFKNRYVPYRTLMQYLNA